MIGIDAVTRAVGDYLRQYPAGTRTGIDLRVALASRQVPAEAIVIAPVVALRDGSAVAVGAGATIADLAGEDGDLVHAARRLAVGELRIPDWDLWPPSPLPVAVTGGPDTWRIYYLLLAHPDSADQLQQDPESLDETLAVHVAAAIASAP